MNDPELQATYQIAVERACLFDLSDHEIIELAGPDAVSFLHNLCTNDIKKLSAGDTCEAFLTNHKARTVAYFLVSRAQGAGGEVLRLVMTPGQAAKVLQHLNRYLISEQVDIVDRSNDIKLLRFAGPQAQALWQDVGASKLTSLPYPLLSVPAVDIFCTPDEATQLHNRLLAAGASRAGPDVHEVLRVEAGTPVFGKDMDEERFVVEVGRGERAICYTKGCYLGQEPIVMARDRGQVNRMLMGLKAGSGEVLAAGAKIFKADNEVGQVTSSVHSPRLGQVIALAYLRRGNWEAGTRLVAEPGGREVEVATLPLVG